MEQLDFVACEKVVSQEMRRVSSGGIGMYAREDVRQECLLAAAVSARTHDGRDGMGYVRTAVRRRLARLLAYTGASRRCPQDEHGVPLRFASQGVLEWQTAPDPSPEAVADHRGQLQALKARLSSRAQNILNRCVEAGEEPDPSEIAAIRNELKGMPMQDPYAVPEINPYEVSCHALADEPEGYDAQNPICHNCTAKFSCLPAAVLRPSVWSEQDPPAKIWEVDDDHEVVMLLNREMTLEDINQRMLRRDSLIADYLADHPDAQDAEVIANAIPEDLQVKRYAPGLKPKPVRRVLRKPKLPRKNIAQSSQPGQKAFQPHQRGQIGKRGKLVPKPKLLTEEQMMAAILKIRLGVRVDWHMGYQIVRRLREGGEHIATLTSQGFLFNGDDQIYGSLSAVAQVASGSPCRSGNDYFGLLKSGNTEVRDQNGEIIARKALLTE